MSIFDRLTDTSQYTGAHSGRFDADGKGRGIKGRTDSTEATAAGGLAGLANRRAADGRGRRAELLDEGAGRPAASRRKKKTRSPEGGHQQRARSPPPPELRALSAGEEAMLESFRRGGAQQFDLEERDADGRTPLHVVAEAGYVEVCRMFLGMGADIDALDGAEGAPPLLLAVRSGRTAVVGLLLAKGADVTLSSSDGTNALMAAAATGHADLLSMLADATSRAYAGEAVPRSSFRAVSAASSEQDPEEAYDGGRYDARVEEAAAPAAEEYEEYMDENQISEIPRRVEKALEKLVGADAVLERVLQTFSQSDPSSDRTNGEFALNPEQFSKGCSHFSSNFQLNPLVRLAVL
jgi:hypothetical protein